jgi:ferritin-like metal-binding protein YciE
MATTTDTKLLQYVNETHALEAALVSTLSAHIAMTPAGPYRDALERHHRETREHAARLESRLTELGDSNNPLEAVYGLAQNIIGQVLALGKAPLDLVRGLSAEEKLLKNARDEAASEALEIATYDGLEAAASALGDEETATIAREHRADEERFLAELRELIPELATDVVDAEVRGRPHYDPGTTGAADAAREVAAKARSVARKAQERVEGTAEQVTDRGAADEVTDRGAADEPERRPGDELPIPNYDELTAEQIVRKLGDLSAEELAAIDGYERATKERKRVLDRVQALRQKRTEEELARIP